MDAQLYQWSCSSLDAANNRYTLPDLGELNEADIDIAHMALLLHPSTAGEVYIFPVSSALNCSGTVSVVKYCYYGEWLGREQLIFTLLTLQQNGFNFSIIDTIAIHSIPSDQICTSREFSANGANASTVQYCCDTSTLDVNSHFILPTPNFAFGIIPAMVNTSVVTALASRASNPIAYNGGYFPDFRVQHYRLPNTFVVRNMFLLGKMNRQTDRTLRLFQFMISPVTDGPATHPTTTNTDNEQTAIIEQSTTVETATPGDSKVANIAAGVGGGGALVIILALGSTVTLSLMARLRGMKRAAKFHNMNPSNTEGLDVATTSCSEQNKNECKHIEVDACCALHEANTQPTLVTESPNQALTREHQVDQTPAIETEQVRADTAIIASSNKAYGVCVTKAEEEERCSYVNVNLLEAVTLYYTEADTSKCNQDSH